LEEICKTFLKELLLHSKADYFRIMIFGERFSYLSLSIGIQFPLAESKSTLDFGKYVIWGIINPHN
jgi:hypothetical protein